MRQEELKQQLEQLVAANAPGFFSFPGLTALFIDPFTKGIQLETLDERNARIRREMRATFGEVADDIAHLLVPFYTTVRKLSSDCPGDRLTIEDLLFDTLARYATVRYGQHLKQVAKGTPRRVETINGKKYFNGKPVTPKIQSILNELDELEAAARRKRKNEGEIARDLEFDSKQVSKLEQELARNIEEGKKKFGDDQQVQNAIDDAQQQVKDPMKEARAKYLEQERLKKDQRAQEDQAILDEYQAKGFNNFQEVQKALIEQKVLDDADPAFKDSPAQKKLDQEIADAKKAKKDQAFQDHLNKKVPIPDIVDELARAANEGNLAEFTRSAKVVEDIRILNRVVTPLVEQFGASAKDIGTAMRQIANEKFGGNLVEAALKDPDGIALRYFRNRQKQ